MEEKRQYGLDNLRFLLIFLVVLGHLLEIGEPFFGSQLLYKAIYSFHMPAFLFLTGYFARYDRKKLLSRLLVPYLIFQLLYPLLDWALTGAVPFFQPFVPYWLLWYLLAVLFYCLLIPVYDKAKGWGCIGVLAGAFILSLAVGYLDFIDYNLTASRFFVFQVWFVLGYYCRRENWLSRFPRKMTAAAGIVCLVGAGLSLLWLSGDITPQMLYGSYSYRQLGYHPGIRAMAALASLMWLGALLFLLTPVMNRNIPLITRIGQNSLPIFLLHGFAVKILKALAAPLTPWVVFSLAAALCLLLGHPLLTRLLQGKLSKFTKM